MIARKGRMDAWQGRQIRRRRRDGLDPRLLVIGDDCDRLLRCLRPGGGLFQDLDLAINTQDLGHLLLELGIATLQVVAHLVRLFDQGWNALREQIIANQKRLRVIPANTQLTPWPDDLAKWETLSADEKKLFAHQADVFAAYTAYTDHEIGRVIQEVQDEG